MKKLLMSAVLSMLMLVQARAQTLEECQRAAERNYPMIWQFDLIAKTTDLTVSNIQKDWLPQVSASAQATLQSDVTAFPAQIQQAYQTMGINMRGLRKDQYRVGIDIQQTVYDGGAISSRKSIAREQGNVQAAQAEVDIYSVRRRVNEMFFALLMLDEQIALNHDFQQLLVNNENKLASMLRNGTASESDYNKVKAERLGAAQQLTDMQTRRKTVQRVLSAFCGIEVDNPIKPAPSATVTSLANERPELKVYDARLRLVDAQEKALNAAIMPRFGLFAQGFYGYPGYNLFEDMMSRRWSLNGMLGARLTWNIGALYTLRHDKSKLQLQRETTENQREVFLFNNRLEQIQQNEDIARYRSMMNDDSEIIVLLSSIRKAAESKLSHGIIDVNDLIREINAETAARVQLSVHEIQMLKAVSDLKYTVNY